MNWGLDGVRDWANRLPGDPSAQVVDYHVDRGSGHSGGVLLLPEAPRPIRGPNPAASGAPPPGTSEQLADSSQGINPVGTSLSADTLSNLARANDLMADIGMALSPSNSGRPIMAAESLRGMIQTRVEVSERGSTQTPLPLLSTIVRGTDPQLVKDIADKWAELFVQRNAQLFATESARSFEFILSQYDENQQALELKRQERLTYQQQNPVQVLQSELTVLTGKFEEFLSQLEGKRAAMIAAGASVESLSEALAKESQFIELKRGISNERIVNNLVDNPGESTLETLADIVVTDQVQDTIYLSVGCQR